MEREKLCGLEAFILANSNVSTTVARWLGFVECMYSTGPPCPSVGAPLEGQGKQQILIPTTEPPMLIGSQLVSMHLPLAYLLRAYAH